MIKLLLYCTKEKNNSDILLPDEHYGKKFYLYGCPYENFHYQKLNGKIVGMCDCELVERIFFNNQDNYFHTKLLEPHELFNKSCLETGELLKYFKPNLLLSEEKGYALYLSNVKRFDEPKEVNTCWCYRNYNVHLKNAPQSMCNVYGFDGNHYILISIHPEHLCKILNGEKTIEVRKNILDDLKPLMETNKNVSNQQ